MRKFLTPIKLFLTFIVMVFSFVILSGDVDASVCATTRVINQHSCVTTGVTCCPWSVGWTCSEWGGSCSGAGTCTGTGGAIGNCIQTCSNYSCGGSSCEVQDLNVSCNPAPACNANVNVKSCSQSGTTCSESNQVLTYECWINDTCGDGQCTGAETCNNCPGDCGSCTGSSSGGGSSSSSSSGGGSLCSGACFGGISNCGEVGRQPGSGSCNAGELCCANFGSSCWPPDITFRINNSTGPWVYPNQPLYFSYFTNGAAWCYTDSSGVYPWWNFQFMDSYSGWAGSIASSFTFSVHCGSSCGNATASVPVTVVWPPPNVSFTVNGDTGVTYVDSGDSVTTDWDVQFATSCTASASPAVTNWSGSKNITSGTETDGPVTSTGTMTLSCTGPGGTTTRTVNVVLNPPPPPTVDLKVNGSDNPVINPGDTLTLAWTTTNGTTYIASGDWTGSKPATGSETDGPVNTPTISYTLTVTGPGGVVSDTVTANVTLSACTQPSLSGPPTIACAANATTNGSMVWSWPAVQYATEYDVDIIDQTGTPVTGQNNTYRPASTFGCAGGGTCSYTTLLPGSNTTTYRIRIQARGTLCTASTVYTSSAQSLPFCPYTVSGTIYQDNGDSYFDGDRCVMPGNNYSGLTAVQPGAGSQVRMLDTGTVGTIGAGGTYTLQDIYGSHVAHLENLDAATWQCTCPTNCNLSTVLGPNDTSVNYFVSSEREPWIQVRGGDIHTQSEDVPDNTTLTISIPVPFTCQVDANNGGSCKPYALTRDDNNNPNSSGIASYTQGAVDLSDRNGNQTTMVSEDGDRIVQTTTDLPRQDFEYFYRQFEFGLNPTSDFANPNNAGEPTVAPTGGKPAYYHSGDLTIGTTWNIAANESKTVFVDNGDLIINAEIHVSNGGFVAFVVDGDIRIGASLSSPNVNDPTPPIEGIYIANGAIQLLSVGNPNPDSMIVLSGSFITWQGLQNQRDFRSLGNNTSAVVTIKYRPDLILNAPDGFKVSQYRWQELAP